MSEPVNAHSERRALPKLVQRFLSALVMAPLALAIVLIGGWPFLLFVFGIWILSLYEWMGIRPPDTSRATMFLQGVFYLGLCCAAFMCLRMMPYGLFFTFALLICVWASDSGAYLVGKSVGGAKMAPVISPNKTWAGFVGALLFCGLALVIFALLARVVPGLSVPHFSLADYMMLFGAGLAFGAVGQAGDLFISSFKRRANVKDTGNLIPGHGGILDRIDALLLVAPIFLATRYLWPL